MRRGEVWLADLDPVQGSEQGGKRPVIVLSRNSINENSTVVIGIPCSTYKEKRIYPFQFIIDSPEGGLENDSVVLTEQITALSKTRFLKYIGVLNPETLIRVEKALAIALAFTRRSP